MNQAPPPLSGLHEAHLRLARIHQADGEARVARQAEIVAELEADGHPAELARALLQVFRETLDQMRVHRAYLEAETPPPAEP